MAKEQREEIWPNCERQWLCFCLTSNQWRKLTVSLVRALKITTSGPNNFLYLTRLCLITSVQHRCQSGNRRRGSSASCESSGWWGWISDSQKTNGRTGFCTAGGNWVHSGETQMLFDLEGLDAYAFNINTHLLGMDSYSDKAVHVQCNTHNELLISIEETNFLAFWETRNETKKHLRTACCVLEPLAGLWL